jgi:hypothetical protein
MRAIDQLGSRKAPVRLGALHALSRLGQKHPGLRQTITEVICAYLRMPYDAPERSSKSGHPGQPGQAKELQVRLTAQRLLAGHLRDAPYGRRDDSPVPETFWPEIDHVDLTGACLVDLNLSHCRVRAFTCHDATFTGESLFREILCDLAFFQKASFKGHADFRGAAFTSDAWFSYADFGSDVWFHGDEFFPAARFGRHASFMNVNFTRKARFEKATFEGSADFREITCREGAKAINMYGCQALRPDAVNPDISKAPTTWPPGWGIKSAQDGTATIIWHG